MKAQLINRSIIQNKSFNLETHTNENFLKTWHYHPEVELIFVQEGSGTRFVGDDIENFGPGETVLIGENLPHQWLYDNAYHEDDCNSEAKTKVIHFHKNFTSGLTNFPEMKGICNLFEEACRGISFNVDSAKYISQKIDRIAKSYGYEKLLALLDLLKYLSGQKEYEMLSSVGYIKSFRKRKDSKITSVYEYVMNNFMQEIKLNKAAKIANMNPSAFSRYFKRIHKKTFTKFVNEVRIGYACKLLIEKKYNISEVCYKSGFNNVSNFNRQFKSLKKMTPTEFINKFDTVLNK